MLQYHKDNTLPKAGWIFVFGSNLAGRHGKGAAVPAHKNFGMPYGQGQGRGGDAYAIPIKGRKLEVLPTLQVQAYVEDFRAYVRMNPTLKYFIVRVGCGLGGWKDHDMAPLFKGIEADISFPVEWAPYVDPDWPAVAG